MDHAHRHLRQLSAPSERDGLGGHSASSPVPEPLPAPDVGETAGAHPLSLAAKRWEAGMRSPPRRLLVALFLLSSAVAGALVWSGHAPFPTLMILSILVGAYFLIVSTTITRLSRPAMAFTLLLCGGACLLVDVLSLLFHLAALGR